MKDRVEEFRKALREKRKPPQLKVATKDIVTVSISVLAFVISLTTAYFNLLRQANIVRVVVHRAPYVEINPNGTVLYVSTKFNDISIINAGNQSAVVSRVRVILQQTDEGIPNNCDMRKDESAADYTVQPILVDPGKIVYTKVKLQEEEDEPMKAPSSLSEEGKVIFETRGDFERVRFVATCLGFEIITPHSVHKDVRVLLGGFEFTKDRHTWIQSRMWTITESSQTTTLLDETSSPLSRPQ